MRDALVYAVPVAVSPVPLGASLLLLTCPRRRPNGLSFLAGWALGVGALSVVCVALVRAVGVTDADPRWLAVVEVVVGGTFVLVAAALWARRDRQQRRRAAPWIDAVDGLSAPRAGGLGIVLAGANPKVVALSLAAALSLARTDTSATTELVSIVLFTLIGALGVAAPLAVHLAAPARTEAVLLQFRAWLACHETMALVLVGFVIGGLFLRDGLMAL